MKNPLRAPEVKAFIIKVIQEAGCKYDDVEKMFMLEYRYWCEFLYRPGCNRHRARELCRENALRVVKGWYKRKPFYHLQEEKEQAKFFIEAGRVAQKGMAIATDRPGYKDHELGKNIDERA